MQEIFSLQSQIQTLTRTNTALQSSNSALSSELESLKGNHALVTEELNESRNRLDSLLEPLQIEVERRGLLNIQLGRQVSDLQTYIAENIAANNESVGTPYEQHAVALESPALLSNQLLENSRFLSSKHHVEWRWTPWVRGVSDKIWRADVRGLQEEIEDLRMHRLEAFERLQRQMEGMVGILVKALPLPDTVKNSILPTGLNSKSDSAESTEVGSLVKAV
jgi:chromosome segregation ATPase